jgi:hypothetical protein
MASLHHLPADQRAVLELVLQRGRNYDQIATLLSVDRAGVRQRALSAFDALAPDSDIAPERRGLIADYLLGQLPPRVAETVHGRLASSPPERAWARILASELAPIARDPLPEIPVSAPAAPSNTTAAEPIPATAAEPATSTPASEQAAPPRPRDGRRSSRLGGAVVLGLGAALVLGVIAVLIFVVFAGSGTKHSRSHPTASHTSSSTTSTATAKPIAQVNLLPPASGSKATGIAQVVQVGSTRGIVLVAQNIPANKNNFYAVWLYNSPSQYEIVGYVNPGVGANGQLQTTGPLPTDAAKYGQLVVALQTKAQPKPPGPIVLKGKLTLK